ncbi:MAG: ATP-binding protein [Sporomusaceae bacterium]|nr:ATP-binding protein [Sporomusaceae bacterium]
MAKSITLQAKWRRLVCWLLLIGAVLFAAAALAAPGDTPQKVLLIFSYNFDYPGIALARKGFSAAFAEYTHLGLPYSLEEIQLEDSDDAAYFDRLAAFLQTKYAADKPDLVIAGYKQAATFMQLYGDSVFGQVPVVFSGIDIEDYGLRQAPANYYGVVATAAVQKNIELMLGNHPSLKKIYIVAGATPAERELLDGALKAGAAYADRVEIAALAQEPYYHMLARLNAIKDSAAILYLSMQLDVDGRLLAPSVVARDISQAAKIPVYGIFDSYGGTGIVGGFFIDRELLGRRTADISLSILAGMPAPGQQVAGEPAGGYWLDWRQLQRWGIDAAALPDASRVAFREFSVWEAYKWQILGGICLLLLQGCLIIILLLNRSMRRKAQDQLLAERESRARSEKMASIGLLAAGIAHELNQPLNAIKLLASGLALGYRQGRERDREEVIAGLESISFQTSRAAAIIDHLRTLVRRDDSRLKACNINAVVTQALQLTGRQIAAHGIRLETRLADSLPAVAGADAALEEVVINLVVNAMQALEAAAVEDKRIYLETANRDGVVLTVTDNGPGVRADLTQSIFEPFVSGKAAADSLGLGLTLVNKIVTGCGGEVHYQAGENGGASFIVRFPAMTQRRDGHEDPAGG